MWFLRSGGRRPLVLVATSEAADALGFKQGPCQVTWKKFVLKSRNLFLAPADGAVRISAHARCSRAAIRTSIGGGRSIGDGDADGRSDGGGWCPASARGAGAARAGGAGADPRRGPRRRPPRARPGGHGAGRPRLGRGLARQRVAGGGDREAAADPDGAGAQPRSDRAARGAGAGAAAPRRTSTPSSPTSRPRPLRRCSTSSIATGMAVAASNAGTPVSFVGSDYGFRTYFTRAMAEGAAQQYALGTVSGRPGLYLSHRVESVLGPVGVVVAKVELDALEARWRESGLVVQVTDADGVVLATTEPAWRFGTTRPLADEPAARAALQLGDAPLSRVPVAFEEAGRRAHRRAPLRRRRRGGRPLGAGLAAHGVPAVRAGARRRGPERRGDGAARRAAARARRGRDAAPPALGARAGGGARGDERRARAPRRPAHRRARPLEHRARRRDRRARGGRDPGARAARRARPGEPAVDPRPGLGRRRARDQPAAGGDPHLRRDRRAGCSRPASPRRRAATCARSSASPSGSARSPRACAASPAAAPARSGRSPSRRRSTAR